MNYEKEFLRAAGLWLWCRLAGMDEMHSDKFGALLGECDWRAEMNLILKEWKNADSNERAVNRCRN